MYLPKKLPYAYSSLEPFIDEETMYIHYNKHYLTYLKNLNEAIVKEKVKKMPIQELIKSIDNYSKTIRDNAGGYYNHSLFWSMLKPESSSTNPPYGLIKKVIDKNFGSYENFKKLILETAKKRFGSGWVWLVISKRTGKVMITETPYQDNPKMYYDVDIILGIDVWEHAYYLKYNAQRDMYVKNIFNVINWDYCNKVLEKYYKA
jgi:Fe-Mn family superoxide dismutase